jgi:N-acetylglutamate synthase-like GNAT family acetyltransferase
MNDNFTGMLTIKPYSSLYQQEVNNLMFEINTEFSLPSVHSTYRPKLPDGYWVALSEDKVVGTVGVNNGVNYAVLKRMFLKKEFRGKEKGIAQKLLQTALNWCHEKGIETLYLGTVERFEAAQRFYRKNGFSKIDASELPQDFANNPIDTLFYKLVLKEKKY